MFGIALPVLSQISISSSGSYNSFYSGLNTNHINNPTHYTLADITVYVGASGIGPSIIYPDYNNGGTQLCGYTSQTPHGHIWQVYSLTGMVNGVSPPPENLPRTFIYKPITADVGNPIHLTALLVGNCANGSDNSEYPAPANFINTATITIEQPMFVNQSSLTNVCQNAPVFQLSDYFSGTATVGLNFFIDDPFQFSTSVTSVNPSKLKAGSHTITAAKQYDNGTFTQTISFNIVATTPIVFGSYTNPICQNSGIVNIPAFPIGGNWQGTAIDNSGNFNPASSGPGSFNLTYSYVNPDKSQNPNGCTSISITTITVKILPIVTAGQPFSVCINGNPVVLADGLPIGGTWTGQGVANNIFTPSFVASGNYSLGYTVTNATGCSNTAFKDVTVLPLPVVTSGVDLTVCSSGASFDLSKDASPAGGSFAGTGVINNSFDPSLSGSGSFTITYTYQDASSGCIGKSKRVITVKQAPVPTAPPNMSVCQNSPPIPLQGATPSGGTYSGVGVINNIFTPSGATVGNNTILYSYQDPTTLCTGTVSFIISVNAAPVVSAGSPLTICYNSGVQTLNGTPAGGTWGGLGVSGNTFDPQISGTGSFRLGYSYQSPVTGCSGRDSVTIIVKPVPVITVPSDTSVCINSPNVKLLGLPAGGTWAGQGVTNNSLNPSKSGVGTFVLTYTYKDQNSSCSNAAHYSVTVLSIPTPTAPPNFAICLNANPILLQGGSPTGGTYIGDGITAGVFYPLKAGLGNHTITYAYKDPNAGCTGYASFIILVKPIPAISAGSGFAECINGGVHQLNGQPSGGTWSGQGINGLNFDPLVAGAGKFLLTYSYQDPSSSCIGTDTLSAQVYALPLLSIGNDTIICQNSGTLNLSASPAGGTWSGIGVYGTTFNPYQASIGSNIVTYTYKNAAGCSTFLNKHIILLPFTSVTIGNPVTTCINSTPYDLTKDASIQGGTWSGAGVSGSFFNASSAGIGTHSISYSYRNVAGCVTSASKGFTVLGIPGKVTITGTTTGCNSAIITLYAQSDSSSNYQWYHQNDVVPFATGATLSYSVRQTETLYCVGVNQLACGMAKLSSQTVLVTSLSPKADIISSQKAIPFGGLIQFTASNSYNVQNYLWNFGDGGVSVEKNPAHYYYSKGNYNVSVILTSPEGCSDSIKLSYPISVAVDDTLAVNPGTARPTGIDGSALETKIYPSPFSDHFTLTCHLTHAQAIKLMIYDTNGKLLRLVDLEGQNGDNSFKIIDLEKLKIKNYYLVVLKSDDLDTIIKVLKM